MTKRAKILFAVAAVLAVLTVVQNVFILPRLYPLTACVIDQGGGNLVKAYGDDCNDMRAVIVLKAR